MFALPPKMQQLAILPDYAEIYKVDRRQEAKTGVRDRRGRHPGAKNVTSMPPAGASMAA